MKLPASNMLELFLHDVLDSLNDLCHIIAGALVIPVRLIFSFFSLWDVHLICGSYRAHFNNLSDRLESTFKGINFHYIKKLEAPQIAPDKKGRESLYVGAVSMPPLALPFGSKFVLIL